MNTQNLDEAIAKVDAAGIIPGGKSFQDIMDDPTVMANLSQKLASAINEGMLGQRDLPPNLLRRVDALKNIQRATTKLEANFYSEVQHLEAKYHKLYQPYYDKRQSICSGAYEPTDEECHESTESDGQSEDLKSKEADSDDIKGIPDFWLTALRNCEIFADVIKECDDEVLSHLVDIKIVYANEKGLDFAIEYHFSDNEWFSNKVLSMSYFVSCEVNDDDPWSFEGATIHACEGCPIDWKKGKNLTFKTIKKKTKSKGKGQSKTSTKQVPNETFFNMFSYTKLDKNGDQDDAVTQALSDNYNRAEFIRDRLIPRAVLFFTGEAVEEDDDDDDEDDEEFGEEDGEDEDGEGGEDYNPQRDLNAAKPPDCKQQ